MLLLFIALVVFIGSDSNYKASDTLREYHINTQPAMVARFGDEVANQQESEFKPASQEGFYNIRWCLPFDTFHYQVQLKKEKNGGTLFLLKDLSNGMGKKKLELFERNFIDEIRQKVNLYNLY